MRSHLKIGVLAAAATTCVLADPATPCKTAPSNTSVWCDPSAAVETRINALVKALTDDEKSGLFVNGAQGVSRLGIPPYNWWSEALHGVARDGVATSFPQIIGVSSSFNNSLFNALGVLTGTEARGKNNGKGFGNGHIYQGLTMWAPNINIFRDPRWGRGHETPGEDPTLNSAYAENYVSGMQGDESSAKYLRVSACLKHYAAYSEEQGRNSFPAVVQAQDMLDTYLPAFETGVKKGKASGLMCSYNAETYGSGVFGPGTEQQHGAIPSCANKGLLNDLVRSQWGFDGYITSDCGAVGNVQNQHHYTNTSDQTVTAVLSAGMDTDCGGFMGQKTMSDLIKNKQVDAKLTDGALKNLFRVQMRLGFFDPTDKNPYASLGDEVVNTPAHQALAKEAADQSLVLLKNEGGTLPLKAGAVKSVAMIGRNAKATTNMQGNYFGTAPFLISPTDGINAYVANNTVTACADQGCPATCADDELKKAVSAAGASDATVIVTGLTSEGVRPNDEAEGHDRSSLLLPGNQIDVVSQAAAAAAAKGKPVVLVIMGGGAVDIAQFRDSKDIGAILWCGYPGQSGGAAIADALFGKTNPSGKLTQTWYPESFTKKVGILDMGMRPNTTSGNPGRSHRFYTGGDEVFKFGAGLSFTTFESELALRATSGGATATVSLRNTGNVDGTEVVLVFGAPPGAGRDGVPLQQLLGYARVPLRAGEATSVDIELEASKFHVVNDRLSVPEGEWQVWTGVRDASTRTVPLRL